ncbi:stage VI sporulation protein D [Fontibacillus phaseoli]|uniref:Stage VI sporulation protein D n=1 Tax=Fontibacillus phaseoli TaxID=1416533 RepID=A0A369BGY8_9BACL|nr:LysM peptidoglycan-binding domain-containing protein [Fontibacillus phaseoli]RCX19858.1 stage VI sporulation protein D [Fontibacillus phaseoli]
MADQSYGLRFDIYERVHLSENVVGIDELEEIELFPKIQVIPGEEYASLRGHLLLSGLYRGGGGTQELEHWIPVEITIPLSRVGKLEDIAVEIENFDVDLLSARSLNITGVLSLQGIETSSLTVEAEEWKDREFVASHEPFADYRGDGQPESKFSIREGLDAETLERSYTEHFRTWEKEALPELSDTDEQQSILTWNDSASPLFAQSVLADKEAEELEENPAANEADFSNEDHFKNRDQELQFAEEQQSWFKEEQQSWFREESRPSVAVSEIALDDLADQVQTEREEASPFSGETPFQFEADAPVFSELEKEEDVLSGDDSQDTEIRPGVEEKKELKIALGSKKSGDSPQETQFGISKLLSTHRTDTESGHILQEDQSAVLTAEQSDGEEVRWKSLFIGNTEDQTPFRKVRLVIVQREETLDEIAERYQLSSRELQLYNRLSEQHISEGQVLYIP